ncbi:hypothetical protein CRUP_024697, partial [Coryphaenoides rupestris]
MMPQHSLSLPSPNPPPFSITVERSTIRPGENITVTLQASSSLDQFKGFLLEARDTVGPGVDPTASWGSFSLLQPNISQLLHCGGQQGSGVSHTSGSRKRQVHALWECPRDSPERVQFFATVVQRYKVFWVQIPGPVLTITGTTGVSTTPGVITPTTAPALSTALSSEGCGHTKSCLREPAGCSPEADQGCVFLSFSADNSGDSVLFELSGPAEGYVAFALSLDKWMGKDDVYLCIKDEDSVNIHAAYVLGRTHPELAQEEVLRDKASAVSNGVLQCSFLRHDRQPLISSDRALITGPPVDLSGSRSPLIIKIHAVMMLVALMWFVSTGVLFARHYKNMWPNVLPRGERLWFQVHRGLMLLAVGLICVAFTLPFLYRGGWSKRAGGHPYMGCTVLALCVLQPIMAVLRPAPDSPRRYLFNLGHRMTGTLVQIVAVVCIYLGFQQQALLLRGPGVSGALLGWLLCILLSDLALQLNGMPSSASITN